MTDHSRPAFSTIAWLDLNVSDVDLASKFYGGLLGWTYMVAETSVGSYHVAQVGDRDIAGIMAVGADAVGQVPPMWTVFLEVAALEDTITRAEAAGGMVLQPPLDVPNGARVAVLADPGGAMFALIESPVEAWTLVRDEPGGLWWAEVLSREPAASTEFYEATFGWKHRTIGVGGTGYTTFWLADEPVAGLMAMPPQMPAAAPSHWLIYFTVADIDRAAAAVTALGGAVAEGPMTTGPGRIAIIEDPCGAVFAICKPGNRSGGR